MIFGMDASRWQGGDLDFHRARREGIEFAILRSWDRSANAADQTFGRNLRVAREAGMVVAAYHFVTPWDSGAVNADHVLRTVPADCPVILDIEVDGGSGQGTSIELARGVTNRLGAAGRRLPLVYFPRWYWDRIGRPDLRGLSEHGLWAARYVNNMGGTPQSIYRHHHRDGWESYGGLPVRILQFTDESTIAGRAPVDANAFPGTREGLRALLGGDELTPEENEALFVAMNQLTGSWDPWKFDGWQSRVDGGVKATFVDFIRYMDLHSYRLDGEDAGNLAAVKKLAAALSESQFDEAALREEVGNATEAALAKGVRVNLDVTWTEESPDGGGAR
jgi:lysozyme